MGCVWGTDADSTDDDDISEPSWPEMWYQYVDETYTYVLEILIQSLDQLKR